MICPKCGTVNADGEWNCTSCRINLYWASQHYDELATIREAQGLPSTTGSASFLVDAHRQAMHERAEHGEPEENRVRATARKAMRERS